MKVGLKEDEIENFLFERGFSSMVDVTSKDYKKSYFHEKTRIGMFTFDVICACSS